MSRRSSFTRLSLLLTALSLALSLAPPQCPRATLGLRTNSTTVPLEKEVLRGSR